MDNDRSLLEDLLAYLETINHYEFESLEELEEYFSLKRRIRKKLLTFEEQ